MFKSIHSTFAADRGSTRWWATIAAAGLILATVSAPAMAAEGDSSPEPAPVVAAAEVTEPAVETPAEEPVVEEESAVEEGSAVEEPAVEPEPASEGPAAEEPAAQEPAAEIVEELSAPAEEAAPAEEMAPADEPAATEVVAPAKESTAVEKPAPEKPAASEAQAAPEPAAPGAMIPTEPSLPKPDEPAPAELAEAPQPPESSPMLRAMAPDLLAASDVGGSISLDFAAAEPTTYDHSTGGGAWMDKDKQFVVESLESGDFFCGDTVSFLNAITVGSGADPSPMTVQLTYKFLLDSTGQTGVALGPVTYAGVTGSADTGNIGDKNSKVLLPWTQTDPVVTTPDYFVPGEVNTLTLAVDDLEEGEQVIVRIDATISCLFQGEPTGNLQAWISEAEVTVPVNGGKVNVGNETVPFKAEPDLVTYGRLVVDKVTDPSGSTVSFPFRVTAPGVEVDPYSAAFSLTDGATPWASGDIYPSIAEIGRQWVTIAGDYTITEVTPLPEGWQVDDLTCRNQDGPATVTYPTATSAVVTLHEGELVTCTFENSLMPGSIAALKYEDLNGNGQRDDGEPLLAGWDLFLDEGADGLPDDGETLVPTGDEDAVTFPDLVPGDYDVCEVLVSGWMNTEPGTTPPCETVTVVGGKTAGPVEFGNFELGTKGGHKWNDFDGDGTWDEGEPPIPGVTIELRLGGDLVASTTTDDEGYYEFTGLRAEDYTVNEVCRPGWIQTYPTASGACGTGVHDFTVDSGFVDTENDFGNFEAGVKGGYKWNDLNGDGTWDEGEPPIPGVGIELRTGEGVMASTTTDAEGYYEFSGLSAGDYTVNEVCKPGWIQTYPVTEETPDTCGDGVHAFTVTSGFVDKENNFGNFALGTKGGYKWNDLDGDGLWDLGSELGSIEAGTAGPAEPGLEGWTINLLVQGEVVDSTLTDDEGYYEFTSLAAGAYAVSETCPAGWMQTYPATTGTCGSGIHEFVVGSGFIETDNNFGNFKLGKKSGYKWNDLDGDGTWDSGEPGIDGVTIQLWRDADGSGTVTEGDTIAATAVTVTGGPRASAGFYEFTGVKAGDYVVAEICQSGWAQTSPAPVGGVCGTGVHPITVTSGFVGTENNFGNFVLGTKSGYKWNDVTPNGVWDTGEPGINGVTIQLWSDADGSGTVTTGDTVVATVLTANGGPRATDGYYSFTGLMAGEYVVAEVCQAGWVQSAPAPVGGVCGTGVHPITVTSGFAGTENNFGNYVPGVPTLDKASDPGEGAEVGIDDEITFTVTVGNTGGAVISGPVVDTLPAGLTVVPGSITGGGIASEDGQSVTWQVTLVPGQTLTFQYKAVVGEDVVDGQSLVNVATFLGLTDQTTHVVVVPDLIAGVEDDEEAVVAGEEIAATGADGIGMTLSIAVLALLGGGLMVAVARRRRWLS